MLAAGISQNMPSCTGVFHLAGLTEWVRIYVGVRQLNTQDIWRWSIGPNSLRLHRGFIWLPGPTSRSTRGRYEGVIRRKTQSRQDRRARAERPSLAAAVGTRARQSGV